MCTDRLYGKMFCNHVQKLCECVGMCNERFAHTRCLQPRPYFVKSVHDDMDHKSQWPILTHDVPFCRVSPPRPLATLALASPAELSASHPSEPTIGTLCASLIRTRLRTHCWRRDSSVQTTTRLWKQWQGSLQSLLSCLRYP
jgi:hypothetical protein